LPRPRLHALLDEGVSGPLTLVVAPAGSGKTSLLRAWSAETPLPVAWLSLDEEDDNPVLLWQAVVTALDGLAPGCAAAVTDLLVGSGEWQKRSGRCSTTWRCGWRRALDHWLRAGRGREALGLLSAQVLELYEEGQAGSHHRAHSQGRPDGGGRDDLDTRIDHAWPHLFVDQSRFLDLVDGLARSALQDLGDTWPLDPIGPLGWNSAGSSGISAAPA
jgi:hypothetical protein